MIFRLCAKKENSKNFIAYTLTGEWNWQCRSVRRNRGIIVAISRAHKNCSK